MDFYTVRQRSTRGGVIEVYPDFRVGNFKDLMVRGKSFYAVWDESRKLWNPDEFFVQQYIDNELYEHAKSIKDDVDGSVKVRSLADFSSGVWKDFRSFLNHIPDSYITLDNELVWENTETKRSTYASKKLPYAIGEGPCEAWEELVSTLYSPEEREKIEWAIGAICSGDSKKIQKFLVFYGGPGTGKSTILGIVKKLFEGYYSVFESRALVSARDNFSLSVMKDNPLVLIEDDGDLSRVEDNTRLNSLVSHEEMLVNEKNKPAYKARMNAFIMMGTNVPVKITDAKSGILRRLIDVYPTGNKIAPERYHALLQRIDFELGAIATHCLKVYQSLGPYYYDGYKPIRMVQKTDPFYDFVDAYWDTFVSQTHMTLEQAWEMYKTYVDESALTWKFAKPKFREELKNYYENYQERQQVAGVRERHVYSEFKLERLGETERVELAPSLSLEHEESIFDELAADYPAQLANRKGTPSYSWDGVKTTLKDLDTKKCHYVLVPENHIVIDFDLRNEKGEKDAALNLQEAAKWPATYAEFSQGGNGVHLHYYYDGDVSELSADYADGIEVKTLLGKASLRRRVSRCNNLPIAHISGGLPKKGSKPMISDQAVKSEKSLRDLIERNLRKEIHPNTKPSIDFIYKILDDAYSSGLVYDVSDLRQKVLLMAMSSTNQSGECLKIVSKMQFTSEKERSDEPTYTEEYKTDDDRLVFYDVEVFPNLFVVCWKYEGDDFVHKMINPGAQEIGILLKKKLVGFYNREYDNHIVYGAYLGYSIEKLYKLSQDLVHGKSKGFREAKNISWVDIYDYSSEKKSLKKFQIALGLNHDELGFPWDQPVHMDDWERVADYCANDVITTEQVHNSRSQDYAARLLLADLSGLRPNDTTQHHTARIIFGTEKEPQKKFVYTDLSKEFPGYKYDYGTSTYLGEVVGEGGLVRAKPGMYNNVVCFDVASMHPTSIEQLNVFGPYTKNYTDIKKARLAIKHKDFELAKTMLGGKLAPYLTDPEKASDLSHALKIVINIVYGLTSAKFKNPFRDERNVDNIVAKRGALFMMDLKKALEERGVEWVHIKTDSIKVVDPDEATTDFILSFGKKYGYDFEVESIYKKFCLINDAVYIAKGDDDKWHATGARFAEPYVYKKLFSNEKIEFEDLIQTRSVKTVMYLDYNEHLEEGEHDYRFVGRVGGFVPIMPGKGGAELMRETDKDSYSAVTGTKGHRWKEASVVQALGLENDIDYTYYEKLLDGALDALSQFGDPEQFRQ